MSVRERNMKLLLETASHIAVTETFTCIITTERSASIIVTESTTCLIATENQNLYN